MSKRLLAVIHEIKALAEQYSADDFDVVRLAELAEEAEREYWENAQ